MPELDYFVATRPLINDTACGDAGIIREYDSKVFIGIIDVLGHGEEAYEVAVTCMDFLEKNHRQDLMEIMEGLHQQIQGTRGAVAALCLLDLETGEIVHVGVGNITTRKFGSSNVRIVPRSGIVGYVMKSLREEEMILYDGDVLVLYTDGIKSSFKLEDYPELLMDDAQTITTHIIAQFAKPHDDAACIALKYQR